MEFPHVARADAYAKQLRGHRADMLTAADMGVLQLCWEEIRTLTQRVAALEAENKDLKSFRHQATNRETYGPLG
jgi:hypothetical protein